MKLIPFNDDVNMQTNPYITATATVNNFDIENRTFTMTPNQYIVLTHSTSPFPVHAQFADSSSKKRWGMEGPKVAVGSSITIGGTLVLAAIFPLLQSVRPLSSNLKTT